MAAERLNLPLLYYADFPYVLKCLDMLSDFQESGWTCRKHDISKKGLEVWQEAICAHTSQLDHFWRDVKTMRIELQQYYQLSNGGCFWKAK
jgi:hypothetical protein